MAAPQTNVRVIDGSFAELALYPAAKVPAGTFFFARDLGVNGTLYLLDINAGVRAWKPIGGGASATGGQLAYLVAAQAPLQLGITYPTISAAVAAANLDGTDPAPIYVTPGTYVEPGPISLSRSIEIIGMGETPEDVSVTFSAGGGSSILVSGATNLGIKNVSITTTTNNTTVDFDGNILEMDRVILSSSDTLNTIATINATGTRVRIFRSTISNESDDGKCATFTTIGNVSQSSFVGTLISTCVVNDGKIVYEDSSFSGGVSSVDGDPDFTRCSFVAGSGISCITITDGSSAGFDGCTARRDGGVPIVDVFAPSLGVNVTLKGRGFSDFVVSGALPYVGPYNEYIQFESYANHRTIRYQEIPGNALGPGATIGTINGDAEYIRVIPDDGSPPGQEVLLCMGNQRADCEEVIVKNGTAISFRLTCQGFDVFDDASTTQLIGPRDCLRLRVIRKSGTCTWDIQS